MNGNSGAADPTFESTEEGGSCHLLPAPHTLSGQAAGKSITKGEEWPAVKDTVVLN